MATQQKQRGNFVAIITMFALYGMVGFVTNLAAPVGKVWMRQPGISDTMSMLGNLMNFVPYLIMGIPAGKLLTKIGYKATALWAIAIGFVGLTVLDAVLVAERVAQRNDVLYQTDLCEQFVILVAFADLRPVCQMN